MFNRNEYFQFFINNFLLNNSSYYSLIVLFIIINKKFTFAEILLKNDQNSSEIVNYNNTTIYIQIENINNDKFNWNIWKIILIFIATLLALITGFGNLLVIQAFRINKQLRTISNYFLLSLAVADLTIGFVSIPIFTAYFVANKWLLGPIICDLWLCIDVSLFYFCVNINFNYYYYYFI